MKSLSLRSHRDGSIHAAVVCVVLVCSIVLPSAVTALPRSTEGWHRLEATGFTVFSNAREAETLRIAQDLAHLRKTLEAIAPDAEFNSPLPSYIYLFRNDATFTPYKFLVDGRPASVAGYFTPHPLGNYIALNVRGAKNASEVMYHEFVHYFINNNLPSVPLWFNEGLAEYYSGFEVRDADARIGLPINHHVSWLRQNDLIPIDQLFAVDNESPEYNERSRRGGFYAESWAMVHYLMVGNPERRPQLFEYLQRVASGEARDDAFVAAFDVTWAALERELARYVRGSVFSFEVVENLLLDDQALGVIEPMSEAETLFRLGDLLIHQDSNRVDEAEDHFRAALARDSRHGPSFGGLGYLKELNGSFDEAAVFYERALELAPSDFVLPFLLGRSLMIPLSGRTFVLETMPPETRQRVERARAALAESTRLNNDFGESWAVLGATYVFDLEPGEAGIKILERASRLLPSRHDIVFNLALVNARIGRRDEAAAILDRLASLSDDETMLETGRAAVLQIDLDLANEHLGAGRHDEAVALFERVAASTTSPGLRNDLLAKVVEIRKVDSYNLAVARYNDVIRLLNRGQVGQALPILEELAETVENEELLEEVQNRLREIAEAGLNLN